MSAAASLRRQLIFVGKSSKADVLFFRRYCRTNRVKPHPSASETEADVLTATAEPGREAHQSNGLGQSCRCTANRACTSRTAARAPMNPAVPVRSVPPVTRERASHSGLNRHSVSAAVDAVKVHQLLVTGPSVLQRASSRPLPRDCLSRRWGCQQQRQMGAVQQPAPGQRPARAQPSRRWPRSTAAACRCPKPQSRHSGGRRSAAQIEHSHRQRIGFNH